MKEKLDTFVKLLHGIRVLVAVGHDVLKSPLEVGVSAHLASVLGRMLAEQANRGVVRIQALSFIITDGFTIR